MIKIFYLTISVSKPNLPVCAVFGPSTVLPYAMSIQRHGCTKAMAETVLGVYTGTYGSAMKFLVLSRPTGMLNSRACGLSRALNK